MAVKAKAGLSGTIRKEPVESSPVKVAADAASLAATASLTGVKVAKIAL
jgi:hypothetical protein